MLCFGIKEGQLTGVSTGTRNWKKGNDRKSD